MNDNNLPHRSESHDLASPGEAILEGTSSWEEAVHNLRYGIRPRTTPEQIMTYQGVATYRRELDHEMRHRFEKFANDQLGAEQLKEKERREEMERIRLKEYCSSLPHYQEMEERRKKELFQSQQRIEQMVAQERAKYQEMGRQRAQQQPKPGRPKNLTEVASVPDQSTPATIKSSQAKQAQHSPGKWSQGDIVMRDSRDVTTPDETMSASPTYTSSLGTTFSNATRNSQNVQLPLAQAVRSPLEGRGTNRDHLTTPTPVRVRYLQQFQPRTIPRLPENNGYDFPVPQPTGQISAPQSEIQHLSAMSAMALPLSFSVDSTDPGDDTIIVTNRNKQPADDGPANTEPLYANSSSVLGSSPSLHGTEADLDEEESSPQRSSSVSIFQTSSELEDDPIDASEVAPPESPTLSDLIGSETSSEADDGDCAFNPRSKAPAVPDYRQIKGFGMRTRQSLGRAKNRRQR